MHTCLKIKRCVVENAMARSARQVSIDPNETQIVHIWNRCVRRAFLCGKDPLTGKDFEHRRQWARERLEHLASIFAIDCITFAILSNHTHQILRSRPDIARLWDDREVAIRWLRISPKRDARGNPKEPAESEIDMLLNDADQLAEIRIRLSDVSWWMRTFRITWRFARILKMKFAGTFGKRDLAPGSRQQRHRFWLV